MENQYNSGDTALPPTANRKYYSVLTDVGIAKIANATVLGTKVDITHFAAGDGNGAFYSPQTTQTTLKSEKWRGAITKFERNKTSANMIDVFAIMPTSVGGFTIREMGIFDSEGDLISIANCPDIEKVAITEGVSAEIELNTQLIISNTDNFVFKVDPTVIIATKADIDKHNSDPNAHTNHFQNTDIHVTLADKVRWNGADILSKSNKVEIDLLKLGQASDDSRLTRLEDSLFNDIVGNPYLITFANLDGIVLKKGVWNKAQKRLEC